MSDFLRRVSRLALGLTPTAQPLVVSRYAPGTLMPALETPLAEDRPLESTAEPPPPQPEAESPAPARPAVAPVAITGRPSAQMAAHSAPRENAAFFSPEASAPTATEAAESSAPPSGNVSQAAASSLRQVRYPADWQAGEVSETAAPLDAAAAQTRAPLDLQDPAQDVVSRYAPGALMPALEVPLPAERPLASAIESPPQPEAESLSPARPAAIPGAMTGRPSAQVLAHSAQSENTELFSPEASAPTTAEAAESSAPPSGNVSNVNQAAASSLRRVRFPADGPAGDVNNTAAPLDAAAAQTRAPLDLQDPAQDAAAQARLLSRARDQAAAEKSYDAGPTREAPPRATPSGPESQRAGAEAQQSPARASYEERQASAGIERRDNETAYVKTAAPAAPPRRADAVSPPASAYAEGAALAADNSALDAPESGRSLRVSPPLATEPAKRAHSAATGLAQSVSSEHERETHETDASAPSGKSDAGAPPLATARPTAAHLLSSQDDGAERAASGQVIRVHIGRVEVRAVMPPAPAVETAAPPAPQLSLNEYLRQRKGRAR